MNELKSVQAFSKWTKSCYAAEYSDMWCNIVDQYSCVFMRGKKLKSTVFVCPAKGMPTSMRNHWAKYGLHEMAKEHLEQKWFWNIVSNLKEQR